MSTPITRLSPPFDQYSLHNQLNKMVAQINERLDAIERSAAATTNAVQTVTGVTILPSPTSTSGGGAGAGGNGGGSGGGTKKHKTPEFKVSDALLRAARKVDPGITKAQIRADVAANPALKNPAAWTPQAASQTATTTQQVAIPTLDNVLDGETRQLTTVGQGNSGLTTTIDYTIPPNVTHLMVWLFGPGGGGGGGTSIGAGYGGGAGTATLVFLTVTPGDIITFTIPAGGAGGPIGANGFDALMTQFTYNGITYTAPGGSGGGTNGGSPGGGGAPGGGGGGL